MVGGEFGTVGMQLGGGRMVLELEEMGGRFVLVVLQFYLRLEILGT